MKRFIQLSICLLVIFVQAQQSLSLDETASQTEINNTWKEQINPIFQGLDKSKVPNAVLLDYAMEFINVPAYKWYINRQYIH